MAMQGLPEDSEALLTRLSQKPGVQSTLILSRTSGAIVRTSGLISSSSKASNAALPINQSLNSLESTNGTLETTRGTNGLRNAEDLARIVWSFVAAAGGLVDELDKEDELKLLRLRTKKNELVIVPGTAVFLSSPPLLQLTSTRDSNFLLVVIHDTPNAS